MALYNLAQNRTETIDLASKQPEKVDELSALWAARWKKAP